MNKIIAVGDIHGDLNQLLYPLIEYLKSDDREYRKLIYLGDYIDRGESNVFIWLVIRWLMKLKAFEDRIIFLRGNHECYSETVFDYFGEKVARDRFSVSMAYDEMHKLPLKIVHYDEKTNILFSHSPLSRPLDEVMKFNDVEPDDPMNAENTYTNDTVHANMEYRNIHGHVHYLSRKEVFNNFFHGDGKMLSLDGDASYGIRLVGNLTTTSATSYPEQRNEKLQSKVMYLVISDDGKEYEQKWETIDFYDVNRNYNLCTLNELKELLVKLVTGMGVGASGDEEVVFDARGVKKVYEKVFISTFGTKPNRNNIVSSMQRVKLINEKKKGPVYYMYDVPVDVYKSYGLFEDMKSGQIGKAFFTLIGEPEVWEKYYNVGYKREMKSAGYNLEKFNESLNNKTLSGGCEKNNRLVHMLVILVVSSICITVMIVCIVLTANEMKRLNALKQRARQK